MWSSAAARGVLGTALMDTRWQRASSCLRSLLPSNGSRQKPRGLSHFKSAATQLSKSFLQLGHTSSISLSLYLSSIHTQTHTQKAHTLLVESWQPSQINWPWKQRTESSSSLLSSSLPRNPHTVFPLWESDDNVPECSTWRGHMATSIDRSVDRRPP